MRSVTILLPAMSRLRGSLKQAPKLAKRLAQSDALPIGQEGREAQVMRAFDVLPRRLPAAPITRCLDANDAHFGAWLRCDPAHVRADLSMGRMLACGRGLGLTAADAEALVAPLRPLFGDEGFPISTPHPERWYLSLPVESKLPAFSSPDAALGADLHAHLPEGPVGLRWRRLLNEAQIILHHHPLNAERVASGQLPVNSVWFWGAGTLPDHVTSTHSSVHGDDPLLCGLSKLAGARYSVAPWEPTSRINADERVLIDVPAVRDVADIEAAVLPHLDSWLTSREAASIELDFADGCRWRLEAKQSRRFWKRSLRQWPR